MTRVVSGECEAQHSELTGSALYAAAESALCGGSDDSSPCPKRRVLNMDPTSLAKFTGWRHPCCSLQPHASTVPLAYHTSLRSCPGLSPHPPVTSTPSPHCLLPLTVLPFHPNYPSRPPHN